MRKIVESPHPHYLTRYICDICKKDFTYDGYMGLSCEVNIDAKIGTEYGDCDDRDHYFLDVCPKCFVEKFVPEVERCLNVKFTKTNME